MTYVTYEQAWTVVTECDICGQDMEISELRYVETGAVCDLCKLSWEDEEE